MKHYVYIFTDPSRNNEAFYVGMGQGARWRRHFTRADRHPMTHRMNLLKEQDIKPIVTFVCSNVDAEFAALIEQEAISKFGRKDLGKGPLLNLTDGGDGCNNPSPETRKKMSTAHIGMKPSKQTIEKRAAKMRGIPRPKHVIDALVKSNTGAKRSAESKQKMADAKIGTKQTPEHKAKISAGLKAAYARKKNGN